MESVGFSFYSDEEKHAISVKHITSPILFDNLKKPIPGGLYDAALGPIDQKGGYDFLHTFIAYKFFLFDIKAIDRFVIVCRASFYVTIALLIPDV